MAANTHRQSHGFYFNGELVSGEKAEERVTIDKFGPGSGTDEIICPHCGREITGRNINLLKDTADFEDLVQWTIPCPSCGRTIRNLDVEIWKPKLPVDFL